MAAHLARVAGNAARCNPRAYSTQAEPMFTHRNAPPMPSLDHLVQPEQDFVSLLTHRVHSILGSAWYSLQAPSWLQMLPALGASVAPEPKPALAFVPEEPITRASVALAFQQERGWRYAGEDKETQFGEGKVQLYVPLSPFKSAVKHALSPLAASQRSFSLSRLYACALVDAARHTINYENHSDVSTESQSFFTAEHRAMFQQYYTSVAEQRKVALIRVPANRPSLDGFGAKHEGEAPSLQYMDAPRSPQAERIQLIATVALATGIAVVGAAASLTAFFRKW